MNENTTKKAWIDNVKIVACILVALGHFFQSMVKSGIIGDNNLFEWFNQTIYYFHVPLFFICSGYLYQQYSHVNTVASWKSNVSKKVLVLGVPYFTFSMITWTIKTLFSDSVNNEIGGLFHTLFITPTSPYWYLYCLFFVFLITPTFRNGIEAMFGLLTASLLKIIDITGGGYIASVCSIISPIQRNLVCARNAAQYDRHKRDN